MNPHHTFPSKVTLSNTILQIKLDFCFFSYLLRRRNLNEKHKNKQPNTSCAGYGKNILEIFCFLVLIGQNEIEDFRN